MSGASYVVGIDIGGTHTDCVASDGHGLKVAKVRTSADPTDGVVEGVEVLAREYELGVEEFLSRCDRFVYSSTTATNVFLERKVPKLGYLCTKGHRDSLWFRDGYKTERWNLQAAPPWQLVPRQLRRPVDERLNYRGEVIRPLDVTSVDEAAAFMQAEKVEAVAICFLWSFVNPEHELAAQEMLASRLPGVPVVLSSDVLPVIREWERAFCTCLSAAVLVKVKDHLIGFRERLRSLGLRREPLVMQCNGGHSTIDVLLKSPLPLIASGPAGGAVAGIHYGGTVRKDDVMTIDTGGTSFDVCVLLDKKIPITKDRRLEGEPIAIPSVELHTIGGGGGSIASLDPGGRLHVGPRSAGARPGPACYGQGGTEPTLTDAYLALGYLNADYFLGGQIKLDRALAEDALQARVAGPLSLSVTDAASRVVEIMNSRMVDAMRLLTIRRGIDPRPLTLVVGGGAGPLQASRLAKALGIGHVLVPRHPGVFCALGVMRANVAHHLVRTFTSPAGSVDLDRLSEVYAAMETELLERLRHEGIDESRIELRRFVDARYTGQVYEVETPVLRSERYTAGDLAEIVASFEREHERLFRYHMDGFPVEFVSCRAEGVGLVETISSEGFEADEPDPAHALKARRAIYSPAGERFDELPVFDGDRLTNGNRILGEAIVETAGSTIGVWTGDELVVNPQGDFEIYVGA
jgi:N-methylhydantoinase A